MSGSTLARPLGAALLLAATAAGAQTAPATAPADSALPRPFWVNVGLASGSDDMFGLGASVTVARSASRIVTVRGTALEEWSWCLGSCAAPSDQRVELGARCWRTSTTSAPTARCSSGCSSGA